MFRLHHLTSQFHVPPLYHQDRTSFNITTASLLPEVTPVWLPMLNLRLREAIHGIAQGTVFMVRVHLLPSSRGSSGDTSVSQRPVPLSERHTETSYCYFHSVYLYMAIISFKGCSLFFGVIVLSKANPVLAAASYWTHKKDTCGRKSLIIPLMSALSISFVCVSSYYY